MIENVKSLGGSSFCGELVEIMIKRLLFSGGNK